MPLTYKTTPTGYQIGSYSIVNPPPTPIVVISSITTNSGSYTGNRLSSASNNLQIGDGIVVGTSTYSGTNYNVYAFGNGDANGTYVINCKVNLASQCYVLAVGGGGSGASSNSRMGGGGGGGVYTGTIPIVSGTGSISITVGNGAPTNSVSTNLGIDGSNTTITFTNIASTNVTAYGGKGAVNGTGGASGNPTLYAGGANGSNCGGGGGGAGQVGGNPPADYVGGIGGNGAIVPNLASISTFVLSGKTISNLYWGGGGGGAAFWNPNGNGGLGGGGGTVSGGGSGLNPPTPEGGGKNTGGGGCGGTVSGIGGSGIVIIAFPIF